jgi:hypothetical protein
VVLIYRLPYTDRTLCCGDTAVVVDNLSNSNPISLERVAKIIGVDDILFMRLI